MTGSSQYYWCCEIFNIFGVWVEELILVLAYIPWVLNLVFLCIYFTLCELLYLLSALSIGAVIQLPYFPSVYCL